MKAIMISIKPKWCAKIMNGEKTIEIRKTMPKCDLPIDVYIYCTKDKEQLTSGYSSDIKGTKYFIYNDNEAVDYRGKVVAKFTLNKVEKLNNGHYYDYVYDTPTLSETEVMIRSCLLGRSLLEYVGYDDGYAWQIDNLEIFDKPKELSDFYKVGYLEEEYAIESHIADIEGCDGGVNEDYVDNLYEELDKQYHLTKAPQSWCYVEVEE